MNQAPAGYDGTCPFCGSVRCIVQRTDRPFRHLKCLGKCGRNFRTIEINATGPDWPARLLSELATSGQLAGPEQAAYRSHFFGIASIYTGKGQT